MSTIEADAEPGAPAAATAAVQALPRVGLAALAFYAGAQVISQVTSLKIGVVFHRAVDMGTFVYPITFTLRDVVHKSLGRSAARVMIVTCGFLNLFLAAYLQWTTKVQSDPSWGLGQEYTAVLGPIWRIVLASIVAMVVSELIDTEVYHFVVTRITTRYQWLRVLCSNAVSIPVDNLIFAVGAFGALPFLADHPGTLPWGTVWDIFVVNLWVKGLVSVLSLPLIYITPDRNLAEQ